MPAGIYLNKEFVQGNVAEENNKVEEQAVDIIITPAENIEERNQFDEDIPFQVIPERIERTEQSAITTRVIRCEYISEVL